MGGIIEKLKSIPVPIWIGLGLVVIAVVFLSSKSSSSGGQPVASTDTTATQNAPVTNATVGTQGSQPAAGTDQELGNLSQITQAGFGEIAQNERMQTGLLQSLNGGMSGVGQPLTQFGGAIQSTQHDAAQQTAANGTGGQPVQSHPSNDPNNPANNPTPANSASGG